MIAHFNMNDFKLLLGETIVASWILQWVTLHSRFYDQSSRACYYTEIKTTT